MKRILLIMMVLSLCVSICACTPNTDTEPTPTAAAPTATLLPTPTAAPAVTPSPTPIPTATPDVPRSNTTGLEYDGAYLPVLVMIENTKAARPQDGLQAADVVYEVPVEGSITRFVCVFSDNVPEKVAPVRSARVPFLYIVREWDAAYMHYGGSGSDNKNGGQPENVYSNPMYKDIVINIDGILGRYSSYYKRDPNRPSVHDVIGFPRLVQPLYDYQPKPLGWLFSSEAAYSGGDGKNVSLRLCTSYDDYVTYTYDAATDVYLRSMRGEPFISAETGERVAVKNVIVQYSTYTTSGKDHIKLWQMTGGGSADIYIGGVLIKGSWEKASATEPTIFRDAEGSQIVLRPGNTWIHLSTEG